VPSALSKRSRDDGDALLKTCRGEEYCGGNSIVVRVYVPEDDRRKQVAQVVFDVCPSLQEIGYGYRNLFFLF
jgi:hypothetical protein